MGRRKGKYFYVNTSQWSGMEESRTYRLKKKKERKKEKRKKERNIYISF